jgi:hypothetical protein
MQCTQEQAVGLITQYEEGEGEGGDDNGLNVSIKLRRKWLL